MIAYITVKRVVRRQLMVSALCIALSLWGNQAFALEVGDAAPNFTLKTNRGSEISLADLRGKVVLVDFWTAWCSKCQRSLAWINKLQSKFDASKFQVLTINLDETPDEAVALLKRTGMELLVAYDPAGQTPEAFQIEDTPTSVIVNSDGKIELAHSGFDSDAEAALERKITELLGGGAGK